LVNALRLLALILLFIPVLALEAEPGKELTLLFPGPPGEWKVEGPFKAILLSDPKGAPPYLAVLEVPRMAPPGSYRVCLGNDCREVRIAGRLLIKTQTFLKGQILTLSLSNEGNLPGSVLVRPARESRVHFDPIRVELGAGEAKDLTIPLKGEGPLVLQVNEKRLSFQVRTRPPLEGKVKVDHQGAFLTLSYQGG